MTKTAAPRITANMRKVCADALARPNHEVYGANAPSQTLRALRKCGLIDYYNILTEAGRQAAEKA